MSCVPQVPRAHEARRHPDRPEERRPLPLRHRRVSPACPTALPAEGRPIGRASSCAARRSETETPRSSRRRATTRSRVDRTAHLRLLPENPCWCVRIGDGSAMFVALTGPSNAARPEARGRTAPAAAPGLTGRSARFPLRSRSALPTANLFFVPSDDPTALGRRLAGAARESPVVRDAGMGLPVLPRKYIHVAAAFRDVATFSTRACSRLAF